MKEVRHETKHLTCEITDEKFVATSKETGETVCIKLSKNNIMHIKGCAGKGFPYSEAVSTAMHIWYDKSANVLCMKGGKIDRIMSSLDGMFRQVPAAKSSKLRTYCSI